MGRGMGSARQLHRLSARAVTTLSSPGYYPDGGGLYLQVGTSGAKSWIYRYKRSGRARDMGLGSAAIISLADARARAVEARRLLADGIDPIEARARQRAQDSVTFSACAAEFIAAHRAGWRSPAHIAQWTNSLAQYASPKIGDLPIAAVDVHHVLEVLKPIWAKKTETATRVRQRIETILDYAVAKRYRGEGANPARWRGHLERMLPKPAKVARVKHLEALPYADLPAFMARLFGEPGVAALALRFTILTCARTGETRGACVPEVDADRALWTVPAGRMKAGREHTAPLTAAAIEALTATGVSAGLYFTYRRKALSENAMLVLLGRMGHKGTTVHGFRSTFKDWATEQTDFPTDAIEIALAHNVGDKTEQAYRRGDLLDKRRRLAEAWEAYCMRDVMPRRAAEPD